MTDAQTMEVFGLSPMPDDKLEIPAFLRRTNVEEEKAPETDGGVQVPLPGLRAEAEPAELETIEQIVAAIKVLRPQIDKLSDKLNIKVEALNALKERAQQLVGEL